MITRDYDYYGTSRYCKVAPASDFNLLVNITGLQNPSKSVFNPIECNDHVVKAYICKKDGRRISDDTNLNSKMTPEVCHHFLMESSQSVFIDTEHETNESLIGDYHQRKVVKAIAEKLIHTKFEHVRYLLQQSSNTELNPK